MGLRAGYKQTEVGVIPEDWEVVQLGELLSFKNGLNKAKEFFGQGTPIVNYMDVFGHAGLHNDDIQGRVTLSHAEIERFNVRSGDVFFTRTSETVEEIGTAAVMLDDPVDTVFSGFVLRGRSINGRIEKCYKKYCFSNHSIRSQITSTATYTTRALTNGRLLSGVWIALPPTKAEQTAIAEALSDVDALLAGLGRLIAKKRALKQAALHQLLTAKVRLPGFTGDWQVKRLGDVAAIRNEKVNTFGNDIAAFCVELEQIGQNTGQINDHSDARNRQSVKYRFQEGDVLFGRLRPYLRKFWRADRRGVCSTEIWPLIPIADRLVPSFLFQTVQTDAFIEAANSSYGTHMPRSDWKALTEFEFFVPNDPKEQTAIAAVLSDMDSEIAALARRLAKTRDLKQAMMQELLTGKTRLVTTKEQTYG